MGGGRAPKGKLVFFYQRKGQHCCANKTNRYPPHPTSWIGSECSPLLNMAMWPNPRSSHTHWIPCGWRPLELCSVEDLSLPCLLPASPVFPVECTQGYSWYIVRPFADESGRSLSPAWCRRIPVYDSSCLFLITQVGPTWIFHPPLLNSPICIPHSSLWKPPLPHWRKLSAPPLLLCLANLEPLLE